MAEKMRRVWTPIHKAAEWILTAAVIALAVYCIWGAASKGRGEFYVFGYKPVVVLTGSMEPFMKEDSLVIVKETKEIGENDVIMFSVDDGTMVCHRVIGIDGEGGITTKGDNNETADFNKVSLEDVKGKVVVRLNFLSKIIGKLRG